jgi:hypothetical protein
MAGIQFVGNSGVIAEVDASRNLLTIDGERGYSVGGEYAVAGWTTVAVAAALAASTPLITLRFATGSTRKAYMTRLRFSATVITPGANGGVPGILAWQRFTTATPTGGTQRTVNKKNAAHPSASDMTDVRDSAAALTVTSVVFGDIVSASIMPTFPELTSGAVNGWFEWIYEPDNEPLVLVAGDGLSMRTQVAMPATTTWGFAYTAHWYEK